jgi:tRNA1(Val) A37 N6-methylase TrmN6
MDIKELQVVNKQKQNHPWEYARSKVVLDILKEYVKTDKSNTVLDIGSGETFLLTQFSDKYPDFKLLAVDTAYDNKLISFLSEKHKNHTISYFQTVDEIKDTNNQVSLVFLLDVIEHIENDIDFLKNLSAQPYIQPDTVFIITVPAYQFLYCKHDQWLGHYRRYSQKLLKDHIENAGFSYKSGGYFFMFILLPRLIQKITEKKNSDITGIGDWNGGKFISCIYEKILLFDYYFSKLLRKFKIRMPGLSTYIICKKK